MNGINWTRKVKNIKCFKSTLMKFFTLKERSLFSIQDPTGVMLLKFKVWPLKLAQILQ